MGRRNFRITAIVCFFVVIIGVVTTTTYFICNLIMKESETVKAEESETVRVEESTEDINIFGTFKTISCIKVSDYTNEYIGYDTNTKLMYYIFSNSESHNISPYNIITEDGTVKQAVFGVDYK